MSLLLMIIRVDSCEFSVDDHQVGVLFSFALLMIWFFISLLV